MAAYHSYSHSFASGSGPTQADLFSLSKRAKLKAKYGELQRNYVRALQVGRFSCYLYLLPFFAQFLIRQLRTELTLELAEKEAKIQRLQDEVELRSSLVAVVARVLTTELWNRYHQQSCTGSNI